MTFDIVSLLVCFIDHRPNDVRDGVDKNIFAHLIMTYEAIFA